MVTKQASGNSRRRAPRKPKAKKKLNPMALAIGGTILAILAIVLTAALWVRSNPVTGGSPEAACFLLIDQTSSAVKSSALPGTYQAMANKAIDRCGKLSSATLIASFDQNGTSIKVETYGDDREAIFSLYPSPSRTERKGAQQLQDQTVAAKETVTRLLSTSTRSNRNSDILNALDQAATELRLVARERGVSALYLVVLTDGIQISDGYSFAVFSESASIQSYLDDVSTERDIADLSGVQVSFAGVNTGSSADGAQLPSWFTNQVEDFWIAYIEASGGSLCYYGPDLIGLPIDC